ncbi:hypothetical protein FB446DRAFT_742333 [Lentinula raphanica]|nr:hypothetical protein FB446DRAFT_742333 [Lentinula raphanica]
MMLFRPFSILVVLCPLSLVFAAPTGGKPPEHAGSVQHSQLDHYEVWFSGGEPPNVPQFTHFDVPDIVHKAIQRQLNIPEHDELHIRYLELAYKSWCKKSHGYWSLRIVKSC